MLAIWKEIHPVWPTSLLSWKSSTMRQSFMPIIFAAALLFKYDALSAGLAMGKAEDGSLEQEAFNSLLSDEATESSLSDVDLGAMIKARVPRVIVVAADPSIWKDPRVLQNGLSIYKRRVDDSNQGMEHREGGQQLNIPILRRDTMRCMVGRVYRPCWDV
uniref:Pro-melanin-concentrating hormone, like n=2 Tax=Nothobranchius rachovii TaxID=451742 RepID=A0A1A8NI47_9TELE